MTAATTEEKLLTSLSTTLFATRIQNSITATDNTFLDNINKFFFLTSLSKETHFMS